MSEKKVNIKEEIESPELNKFTLNFSGKDSSYEEDYRVYHFKNNRTALRFGVIFGALLYTILPFGIMSIEIFSKHVLLNLVVAMPIVYLSMYILSFTKCFAGYNQLIVTVASGMIAVSLYILVALFPDIFSNATFLIYLVFFIIFALYLSGMRFINAALISSFMMVSLIIHVSRGFGLLLSWQITPTISLLAASILSRYFIELNLRRKYYIMKKLMDERAKVFEMNRELESSVEEKTSELIEINENLKLEIVARKFVEKEIKELNNNLEKRVIQRTEQLQNALNELNEEVGTRKKAEAELIEAKEQVMEALKNERQLSKMRSGFLSNISHEYRTPLTVILSSTYLLEIFFKEQKSNEFTSQLDKIRYSINEMTRLLDNVRIIEKSEAEGFTPKYEEIELIELINNASNRVRTNTAETNPIIIKNDESEYIIKSDRKILTDALVNILENAVKYSGKNTDILIYVNRSEADIQISIENKGIGIPKEDIDIIFEPFRRASNVGAISGSGLGLTIAKRGLNSMNIAINAESVENGSTVFNIIF